MTTYGEEWENQNPDGEMWDPEIDAYTEQLEGLQKAALKQRAKAINYYKSRTMSKKDQKYSKRFGTDDASVNQAFEKDPGLYEHAMDRAAKTFHKTVAKGMKGQRGPARASDQPQARGRRPLPENMDINDIRARSARGQHVTKEEQDAILDAALGDIFS